MRRSDPIKERADPNGRFQPGDPLTGTLPTRVSAEWLNSIQEEIANVIEGRGLALDQGDSSQLLKAIIDIYRYGDTPRTFPIDNEIKVKTDLPIPPFDSSKHKMIFFNAVSARHTTTADVTYFTSHVAVFDMVTLKWSLVTHCNPTIPVEKEIARIETAPHWLTLSGVGQLQYQTSKLDGESHQGMITLTHFKYVRR